VLSVGLVRTRNDGQVNFADISVKVNADLSLEASHDLADKIEFLLAKELNIDDTTVHI
jgi:divalent metal cation (Fe/Co/Zn/Cd) transporter